MDDREEFIKKLEDCNYPLEQWDIAKLKKEAEGDSGMGQSIERDDIGID